MPSKEVEQNLVNRCKELVRKTNETEALVTTTKKELDERTVVVNELEAELWKEVTLCQFLDH